MKKGISLVIAALMAVSLVAFGGGGAGKRTTAAATEHNEKNRGSEGRD